MSEFRTRLGAVPSEVLRDLEVKLAKPEAGLPVDAGSGEDVADSDWGEVLGDEPDEESIIQEALEGCETHESEFLFRGLAALILKALGTPVFRETAETAATKSFETLLPHDETGSARLCDALYTATLMSVDAVLDLASSLANISIDSVVAAYDANELSRMDVYPSEDWATQTTREAILEEFDPFRRFIAAAASAKQQILIEVDD